VSPGFAGCQGCRPIGASARGGFRATAARGGWLLRRAAANGAEGYRPPVAHIPAPAKTSTSATKTTASIFDKVQVVGIVDNSVPPQE
jgi:hypothetical protein